MNNENKSEMDFGVNENNSEALKSLSERIRKCAEMVGSGDNLAKKAGIPRRTLETYLAGKSEPKALRLAAIIEASGVSAIWLLTGKGPVMPGSTTASAEDMNDEFALIPGYNIEVAAGEGVFPSEEKQTRKLAFRHRWLRYRGLSPENLVLVFARGDSMEPTISNNNTLMIDTTQRDLNDGQIYVIRTDGHLIVKRIQKLWNKGILLLSDNKEYKEQQVEPGEADDLEVIGRVVWIGKDV